MGQDVLQFIPFFIALGFYGSIIAAAIWLLRKLNRMFETQQQMAAHIEAIARIVARNDAERG